MVSDTPSRDPGWRSLLPALAVGAVAVVVAAGGMVDWESVPPISGMPDPAGRAPNVSRKLIVLAGALGLLAVGLLAPWPRRWLHDFARSVGEGRRRAWAALREELTGVSRTSWLLLGVITVVSAGLRLRYLDKPLTWDEGITLFGFVLRPWWAAPTLYPEPNNHILNSELAYLATTVFGDSLVAFRLHSFLIGCLLVMATWLLGRRLYDDRAGLVAAALAGCSAVLVAQATEARGYALVGLAFLLTLYVADRLRGDDNPAWWVGMAAISIAGLYAIPTMLFPLSFTCAWMLVSAAMDRHVLGVRAVALRTVAFLAATGAVTAALYIPVVVFNSGSALLSNEWVQPMGLGAWLRATGAVLATTWSDWSANLPSISAAVLVLALAIGIITRSPRTAPAAPILLGLIGPIVLVLLRRATPPDRAWVFLQPVLLILAGVGITRALDWLPIDRLVPRRAALFVATAALAGSMAIGVARAPYLISPEWEEGTLHYGPEVASFLESRLRPGDVVLAPYPATHTMRYELRRNGQEEFLSQPASEPSRYFEVDYYYPGAVVVFEFEGSEEARAVLSSRSPNPMADRTRVPGESLVFEYPPRDN